MGLLTTAGYPFRCGVSGFEISDVPLVSQPAEMEQQDDYEIVKRKRKFEIFCFIVSSLTISVAVIVCLVYKRAYPFSCNPEANTYMKNISLADEVGGRALQSSDGQHYPPWAYWISQNGTKWGCPCLLKPCIRKCCGLGEQLDKMTRKCVKNDSKWDQEELNVFSLRSSSYFHQVSIKNDHFYIIVEEEIPCESRLVVEMKGHRNPHLLLDDGGVFRGGPKKFVATYSSICVQPSPNHSGNIYLQYYCQSPRSPPPSYLWRGVGMLISVPCLIVTLLVHVLLPPLFNMHGKALVCHLASLTVAYCTLAAMMLGKFQTSETVCIIIGFIIQISALTSFFWLNVMCFDIWWVFSGLVPQSGFRKAAEQFKFRLYSLYAWGTPLVIAVFTLIMEYLPGVPPALARPRMGYTKCFFHDRDGSILYLYLPLGLLVYLNTVMFVITSMRLRSHTKTSGRLERGASMKKKNNCRTGDNRGNDNMNKFGLFAKLSAVMGLNWILEILSIMFVPDASIWCVTDVANALVGLAMLYLFVCKRRVLIMLNEKFCPNWNIISREETQHDSSGKVVKAQGMCTRYAKTRGEDSAPCSGVTEVSG